MSFTDADLIARVLLSDDQHAFGELVRRYQSPMRGFLYKMTNGDTHLADDLAQESFIRAWRKLDTFRGEAKFSTWLFGIAYNQWRMNARGQKELALADLESPPAEAESPATSNASTSVSFTTQRACSRTFFAFAQSSTISRRIPNCSVSASESVIILIPASANAAHGAR